MASDKVRRQETILRILERQLISNQSELQRELEGEGFPVTQATLSRDLKELGVVKRATSEGVYKYTSGRRLKANSRIRFRRSGNLLVMKTEVGLAPRIAYAVDALGMAEILGTVAGEDTLLVVLAEEASGEVVQSELERSLVNEF